MVDKKISVIVPIYNSQDYLDQCVQSLLTQTYANIEIILVDDGSTDASGQMCDEYAARDSRVRVIHQKNARIGAARNRGLDVATGEYITFIDSDDFIESDTYKVAVQLMHQYDADMVQWDLQFLPEDENSPFNIDNREESEYTELVLTRNETFLKFFEWKNMDARFNHIWTDTHCVWTKLCRRELLENIRFPVGKEYEDEMVLHHIVYGCKRVVMVNRRFSNYRLRARSTVHTMPLKGRLDKVDANMDRFAMMLRIGEEALIKGSAHDCLVGAFNIYLYARKEHNKSIKCIAKKNVRHIVKTSGKILCRSDRMAASLLTWFPFGFIIAYHWHLNKKKK